MATGSKDRPISVTVVYTNWHATQINEVYSEYSNVRVQSQYPHPVPASTLKPAAYTYTKRPRWLFQWVKSRPQHLGVSRRCPPPGATRPTGAAGPGGVSSDGSMGRPLSTIWAKQSGLNPFWARATFQWGLTLTNIAARTVINLCLSFHSEPSMHLRFNIASLQCTCGSQVLYECCFMGSDGFISDLLLRGDSTWSPNGLCACLQIHPLVNSLIKKSRP